MEDITQNVKVSFLKNIDKVSFNTTISIAIDNNANIKRILDINSYMYDHKVECGNGKAIISGKIGLKVFYIDTDNIANTLSDSSSFSETIVDASITTNTNLNIFNSNIVNTILSVDNILKINCEATIVPVAYLNLALNNPIQETELLITKKREIQTNTISSFVNLCFEYNSNIETKDKLNKILCNNSYFTAEKVTAGDGYAVVEGKIMTKLVYETNNDDDVIIKEIKEVSNLKCDLEIANIKNDDILDLSFILDKSQEEVSTEMDGDDCLVLTKHKIKVCGAVIKSMTVELVDDLFSTSNEVQISTSSREIAKSLEKFAICEVISNELSLDKDETAIDDVIANLSINPEITNIYVKNSNIYIEGIISSNLSYIDENKEHKLKPIDCPFIINTKIPANNLGSSHSNISIEDAKVKVKRGTIIELEYCIFATLSIFEKEPCSIIDNFSIGKPLSFGNYDYQIFIAKPNETLWDLCKRIKISPNEITTYNKNLPAICNGGEKVIIKR